MKRKVFLWIALPPCAALYQLFMELTARGLGGSPFGSAWFMRAVQIPWLWAALACEAAAFVLWMNILAETDLSKAFPLSAVSYVLVTCIALFVFKEPFSWLHILGSLLILGGIRLIGTAATRPLPGRGEGKRGSDGGEKQK